MKYIYEHAGVMLEIQYTRTPGEPEPTYESIRVLDDMYRPTGPDLIPLLHTTAIVDEAPDGDVQTAIHFLSAILEELP